MDGLGRLVLSLACKFIECALPWLRLCILTKFSLVWLDLRIERSLFIFTFYATCAMLVNATKLSPMQVPPSHSLDNCMSLLIGFELLQIRLKT